MAIVNFNISPVLEKQINQAIKQDGFSSKAEFFRYSAMEYIKDRSETRRKLDDVLQKMEKLVKEKLKGVDMSKWPSGEEQLKDLL